MASPPPNLSVGEVSVGEVYIHMKPAGCSLPCPRMGSGAQSKEQRLKTDPPPLASEQGRS